MNNLITKNIKIILVSLIVGTILGWFANNYYYKSIFDVEAAMERLGLTDEEPTIKRILPQNCTASSQANENQSCEKLYDFTSEGWEDADLNCKDQWIELNFEKENYVEFVVFQNYEYEGLLAQKDKIREIELITSSGESIFHTLENSPDPQWVDLNINTLKLRVNILSSYDTIGVDRCHLESIDIYGRSGN